MMRSRSATLLLLIFTVAALVLPSIAGAAPPTVTSSSRYIVVLKDHVDVTTVLDRHLKTYGVVPAFTYSSVLNGYATTISPSLANSISHDPDVRFVAVDGAVSIDLQSEPSGIRRIDTAPGPARGTGVHVAVLDTGIDYLHPDLKPNIAGVFDCLTGADPIDLHGHGTHVAGTIAAVDNTIGVVGVAPEAKIWGIRVLSDTGYGFDSSILCGLEFVHAKSPITGLPDPIRVVNLSLGGEGADDGNCGLSDADALHLGICNVVKAGITVVAAAGNDSSNMSRKVPASYDEVISVTALADSDGRPCGKGGYTSRGSDDTFASFSNYASGPDVTHTVAAPGVDIKSTYPVVWGSYTTMSGTSMASPHVAGAAAIYIEQHPGATPADVLAGLMATSEAPNLNFQSECPSGILSHTASKLHPEGVIRFAVP